MTMNGRKVEGCPSLLRKGIVVLIQRRIADPNLTHNPNIERIGDYALPITKTNI